jgi:hypothetical protein
MTLPVNVASTTVALSVARVLKASYNGPLIRLHKTGGSEQDIGNDGSGNLDVSAATTFLGGGTGYITTIYDQNGGTNWTQAVEANMPVFSSSRLNSKASAVFTSNQWWNGPSLTSLVEGEIVATLFVDNSPALSTPTSGIGYFGTSIFIDHYPFTDGNIYNGWGSASRYNVGHPAFDLKVKHCLDIVSSRNSDFTLNINNSVVFASTNNVANSASFSPAPFIGKSQVSQGITSYFTGTMTELLLWSPTLSSAQRNAVWTDIHNYYGLAGVVPAGGTVRRRGTGIRSGSRQS